MVQNSANPFVQHLPKYLRTVKCPYMVVRRTSPLFYCNFELCLLKLQETAGTSHADIDQDDVSLAGVQFGEFLFGA